MAWEMQTSISGASAGYPPDWSGLTREQKRQWRFDRWRERAREATSQSSPEAQAACLTRLERFVAVFNLREPDRVPVSAPAGMLPLQMHGLDYHTSIYHPDRAVAAMEDFNRKYADELDTLASWEFVGVAAQALDLLGLRSYAYPGRGMDTRGVGFQFVEGEYMRADEYDALLKDPSDFWLRRYFPRVYEVFAPLASVPPLTDFFEIGPMHLWPLARPELQEMLSRLLEAGKALENYQQITAMEKRVGAELGFPPSFRSQLAFAPFDVLADTLRGTRGIMMDMFRCPDKLQAALDRVADLTIDSILRSPVTVDSVGVFFPLHKGADGWMSEKQFLSFYWPSLRKVINALLDEGLLVGLFAEGSYNTRLELVNEFPKGSLVWEFDRTDMARAKRILGETCCLHGNVPSSLLVTGSPEEVREYCRRLIEICAPGGGYILAQGAIPELPKLDNLRAMAQAAREYGTYERG